MSQSKNFFKNTVATMSRQVLGVLLGLLVSVIIARVLGPNGNGIYTKITLLPTTLETLLNLGVISAGVYFVGQKKYEIKDIVKTNTYSGLLISMMTIVVGAIVVQLFADKVFQGVPHNYMYLILIIMPLLLLNDVYLVVFQGVQDFRSFNALALARQIANLGTLALFLFVFHTGVVGTVFSFSLGVLGQFLLTLYLLKKRMQITVFSGKFSKDYYQKSFSFGIKAHFSNILSFINYRADMFIISAYLTSSAVGLYGVAVSIAEKLWIISQAIASVLYPVISSSTDENSRNRLTSVICRNVLFFSIVGGIIFYLASDLVFAVLFGTKYNQSSYLLKLLMPGIILFSVDRILSGDLAGRGKPELNMYTSIFTVVANIALNIYWVPRIGIAGSSIASAITYSLSSFIKMVLFKRYTGVPYSQFLFPQKEDLVFIKQIIRKKLMRGR
jgi:O-antigen/teichoic acid export membrane protein